MNQPSAGGFPTERETWSLKKPIPSLILGGVEAYDDNGLPVSTRTGHDLLGLASSVERPLVGNESMHPYLGFGMAWIVRDGKFGACRLTSAAGTAAELVN